jgi:general secretion pathway protein G
MTNVQRVSRTHQARRSGFTLIELLLVMVILVVLAAVVVPKFTNRSEQARQTAAKTDLSMLETALDAFEVDNGRYPTDADGGIEALVRAPSNMPGWKNPYIKGGGVPKDPWGNPYVYKAPGAHNTSGFDLSSMGPDGREGGDDITNWQ